MAIELYNTAGQLEADLQAAVDRLVAGPHLVDWSDLVLSRPQSVRPPVSTQLLISFQLNPSLFIVYRVVVLLG